MNIEEALDYICEHQFELDAKMRKAIYVVMNDRRNKRRQLLELIEHVEREISIYEGITQRIISMRKRLDMEEEQ